MSHRIEGPGPSEEPKRTEPTVDPTKDFTVERAAPDSKAQTLGPKHLPDFTTFKELGKVSALDEAALNEFKDSVNLMADEMEKLLDAAEDVVPEEAPRLEDWAERKGKALVDAAIKQVEASEHLTSAWEDFFSFPFLGSELAETYIAGPLEKIIAPFEELEKHTKSTAVTIMDVHGAFQVASVVGKTASLIYKRIVLKQAKKQVELMLNSANPDEVVKAKKLKGWLELQDERITEQALETGLEFLAYSPKGLKAILVSLDKFQGLAAYGDLWAAAVTGVVVNAYKVYKTGKDVKTQEEWLQEIRQAPLVPEAITDEGSPVTLKAEISSLLSQRKASFIAKKNRVKAEFTQWIYAELFNQTSFEELLAILKEQGVRPNLLEVPIGSKDELMEALEKKGDQADQLLSQYAEHKTTISVLTRQAIKTLSEKKQRVEKKFNQFELNKSKVALAISIISFAVVITLKTIALAAIIVIPAVAMSATGAGIFALGLAVLAVGLIYLYKSRPHIFKEYFRGTQIKAVLFGIPYQIDNFVVKIKQIKQLKESLKLMEFRAQAEELRGILERSESVEAAALPKRLKPLFKQLQSEAAKKQEEADVIEAKRKLEEIEKDAVGESEKRQAELESDIRKWTEKAEKWKKKLIPLQKRLREAGSKDFARAAKLAEDREGNPLKIEEIIAEGLFNDTDLLDEETAGILQKELGVDFEKIRSDPDAEKTKQDTLEALESFFAMDNKRIVAFIQEQKAKERYT